MQCPVNLVTFSEDILNGKLTFFCALWILRSFVVSIGYERGIIQSIYGRFQSLMKVYFLTLPNIYDGDFLRK